MAIEIVIFSLIVMGLVYLTFRRRREKQITYIKNYKFPKKAGVKIKDVYPHLNDKDVSIVFDALRDYFYICNISCLDPKSYGLDLN